jgi:hypothetical protein
LDFKIKLNLKAEPIVIFFNMNKIHIFIKGY